MSSKKSLCHLINHVDSYAAANLIRFALTNQVSRFYDSKIRWAIQHVTFKLTSTQMFRPNLIHFDLMQEYGSIFVSVS